jgi:HAD superfamily hydrolase (TIGR01509 family)
MIFLFDCDGVLVDSEIVAASVDVAILASVGYQISTEDIIHRYAGLTFQAMVAIIAKEKGRTFPKDIFEKQQSELDRRLMRETKPVVGAVDILSKITGPRGVCSNSTNDRLRITLGGAGLIEAFEPHIYSAVEVGDRQPKPAPNVYVYAAQRFGVEPKDCIVIEDTVFGVAAAKAAGARVVGFTGASHSWPGHADVLTEAGAETVINRFRDLPAVAEALASWAGLPD